MCRTYPTSASAAVFFANCRDSSTDLLAVGVADVKRLVSRKLHRLCVPVLTRALSAQISFVATRLPLT